MAREQRRLAAIVSADVAGYSRLMGRDESGTLTALKDLRHDVVDPPIAAYGGRIVKTTGDGLLLEFSSVVDAVRCMVEVQTAMADRSAAMPKDKRIAFRIGINLGDIIIDGDDIFGDGVNIAARLQEIADPGGMCVSSRVHDDVRDRLQVTFEDGGTQSLKNIARSLQVWRWSPGNVRPAVAAAAPPLGLANKPSIAVLPFQNMSGDPEQEYFADGMVEDIITALSRTKALFVIARNSSFAYKGTSPDIRQVGRDLGVRYVLEGSVRKAGSRVRITGQLIDAATGAHVWADRFEGGQEEIFELQDRVAARVVRAIQPTLYQAEIEQAHRKPIEDAKAFDWHLRGLSLFYQFSREANEEALNCFYKATALDPSFAMAFSIAALCHLQRSELGMVADEAEDKRQAEQLAQRALDLDPNDPRVLCNAGAAFSRVNRMEESAALFDLALQLDPNSPAAQQGKGWMCVYLGEEGAIEHFQNGFLLNPLDHRAYNAYLGIANAQYLVGDYEGAVASAAKGLRLRPRLPHLLGVTMASHAMAGRVEEAHRMCTMYMQLTPWARISKMRSWYPLRRDEDFEKVAMGLRLAGMPD